MRRIALAVAATTAFFAATLGAGIQSASAASATYNWTGYYIGGNGGYGWGSRTATFTPNDSVGICSGSFGSTCPSSTSLDTKGGLGGLQAGYNLQLNQSWLAGIEADFDWSRIRGTGTSNFLINPTVNPPGSSSILAEQNVKWFGTVRARLGWLPKYNMLVYATGGFAYGRIDENVTLNAFPNSNLAGGGFGFQCSATGTNCFLGSRSRTATGWTAGGGLEYAPWNNISVKAEYLYVNLGSGDTVNAVAQNGAGVTPASFATSYSRTDFHVLRAGLNLKFGAR
jgi:outer membrane immunogenic protein